MNSVLMVGKATTSCVRQLGAGSMSRKRRQAPVEIAGYVNQRRWIVDIIRGTDGFKWYSVINDNYLEDEELPWNGDSSVDDCPF